MFFSNIVNEISLEYIEDYFEYNYLHWKAVSINTHPAETREHLLDLQRRIHDRIPIIVKNEARKAYEIEKEIERMIEEGADK